MTSLGPLLAFLSSVTWAIGSTGYSRISRTHSAYALNFTRALVALPLFIIATWIGTGGFEQIFAIRSANLIWLIVSMVASYGLGDICFFYSTRGLGVPGALAIASCYPIWTALGSCLFEGEILRGVQILGLVTTLAGIIVVILNGPRRGEDTPSSREARDGKIRVGLGFLLAILCSFFWGLNSFALAHLGKDLPTSAGNAIRMVLGLLITFSLGRAFNPSAKHWLPLSELKRSWWIFVTEAFGGSYFFMYGLTHSPLAIGATLTSLAPVLSVPVAWVLKLEKFSLPRTAGVFLTVLGLCLLVGFAPVLV